MTIINAEGALQTAAGRNLIVGCKGDQMAFVSLLMR